MKQVEIPRSEHPPFVWLGFNGSFMSTMNCQKANSLVFLRLHVCIAVIAFSNLESEFLCICGSSYVHWMLLIKDFPSCPRAERLLIGKLMD